MYPDVHAQVIQVAADTSIRVGPTLLHAVHIAADGAAKGDLVEIVNAPATGVGTDIFTYVIPSDADNYSFCPSTPVPCAAGLYVDITLAGAGNVLVTVVYS